MPIVKGEQTGYINGQINASADGTPDQDFFSFSANANDAIHLDLSGSLVYRGGRITLYDADEKQMAVDADGSDGLTLDSIAAAAGTYFVRVDQPGQDPSASPVVPQYRLDVTTKPYVNPVQGPDEQEPNDTFAQANTLTLQDVVAATSGIGVRAGAALGIAGGPTNDQDVFRFDVKAGEHVHVAVDGLVCDPSGGVFASLADWMAANHVKGSATLSSILKRYPNLAAGAVQLAVYDAAGNQVGSGSDNGGGPGSVVFDAATDATYYAVISVPASSAALVHYRLSMATVQSHPPPSADAATAAGHAFVKVLHDGQTFGFVDASGDKVRLLYRGPGSVTVTFTGVKANGSDIATAVVKGAAASSFFVQTAGSAEVGAVVIHGLRQRGNIVGGFGPVFIQGSLGSLSSDTSVNNIVVSGYLGEVSVPGKKVGQVKANTFDTTLTQAAAVGKVLVQDDLNAAALKTLAAAMGP